MRWPWVLGLLVTAALTVASCGAPKGAPVIGRLAATGRVSAAALSADAHVVSMRLAGLGHSADSASVRGGSIVVAGSGRLPSPSTLIAPGRAYLRPVRCGAPAQTPDTRAAPGPLPACGPPYATTVAGLAVTPNSAAADGYVAATVPPDPAFARDRSTPPDRDDPTRAVLLPADPTAGPQQYPRFVLGPSSMPLGPLRSVAAVYDTSIDEWAVMYSFTHRGAARWDRVAEQAFHRYIGVDIDGLVVSAPIIQPTQSAFTSFEGRGEISGDFTRSSATDLAALLQSGPLVSPLRVEG